MNIDFRHLAVQVLAAIVLATIILALWIHVTKSDGPAYPGTIPWFRQQ